MLYTIRLAREDQNVLDQGGPAGVVVLYILLFVAWTVFFSCGGFWKEVTWDGIGESFLGDSIGYIYIII
jgi:hypothetical protein